MIYSPIAYVVLLTSPIIFLQIENPLGWGNQFAWSGQTLWSIPIAYLSAFALTSLSLSRTGKTINSSSIRFSKKYFWIFLLIATSFQLSKFINIGDIPLLGDPMSRYKLTIGGYADYPSKLLAPLCWIAAIFYKTYKKKIFLLSALVPIALNLLMLQRQEIAYCVIGMFIVFTIDKKISVKTLIILLTFAILSAYLIGYGAILRYGAKSISWSIDETILPFWIMHAEITVPTILSHYVIESLNGDLLYGAYTFSSFFDIFSSSAQVGADLIRAKYTNAETAQSISAPYSYYIDFGYAGVIAIGAASAAIICYGYNRTAIPNAYFPKVCYALVFLTALWSIRSGTSILNISLIYILIGCFCMTTDGSPRVATIRKVLRPAFFLILAVSYMTLAARI